MSRSLFVLQGGGPTAVINATLAGIAEDAGEHFDSLLGLRHSFEGKEGEEALDLSYLLNPGENKTLLDSLASTRRSAGVESQKSRGTGFGKSSAANAGRGIGCPDWYRR